uniref:Ataxin-2 C-terminal domain-containing protein n=1 Tax=Trichuris muris TaxID=70415 RepID=A0A5S6PZ25_TRIMR
MDKDNASIGSWSDVQAPMTADTFRWSAAGFNESWFDFFRTETVAAHGHERTPPTSKNTDSHLLEVPLRTMANSGNAASGCAVPREKSFEIITSDNELEFCGGISPEENPEAIKRVSG